MAGVKGDYYLFQWKVVLKLINVTLWFILTV